MKILLAHNYYGSTAPSGENQVFEAERELLRQRGHEVDEFVRYSDKIRGAGAYGVVAGAMSVPYNPWAVATMRRMLSTCSPSVVHAHNTFPLISPGIFRAIGDRAARVLTLHNYRVFCAAAIPMRDGKICTECLDRRSSAPAMRYGCYRNSRLATLPLAFSISLHRVLCTWTKNVDAFIALTEFQRDKMIQAGLPAELVHVKPNFYPGNPATIPWYDRRRRVVFAGRLTTEKGVQVLVSAWLRWGRSAPELRIVGDGNLRGELERLAASDPLVPIRFLGQLSGREAQAEIAKASLLVLPSECFEGFPMVVREAFAFGTPVAVSAIGPLPSIVGHGSSGVVFAPGNPQSLLSELQSVWDVPGLLERLGNGARAEFESKYTEEVNYSMLMAIYEKAIKVSRNRRRFGCA
jgi:glycosyltransferase involved in cell wall biosynthesis